MEDRRAGAASGGGERAHGGRAASGHLQPFAWAVDRLGEAFGQRRVVPEVSADGRQVVVAVAPDDGEAASEAYTVILRDPILGNVNRQADPPAWLEAEIGHVRAWLAGESRRRRTFG